MPTSDGAIRERLLRDAVLAGDEIAWRAWYEETYAPLEAYVLWRCGRLRDLGNDVLQETWLTAVRLLRRFDPRGKFLELAARHRVQRCPQPTAEVAAW